MKNFTLFFTLLLLPLKLLATDCIPDCECETDWTLEVRGAYYQPCSKKFTKVYSRHLLDYQVEAAKRIHPFGEIWGSVSWASKQSHLWEFDSYSSHKFKERTKIFILPISLGGKIIYPILPCVDLYVGAGVCYSFLRIKNSCKDEYSGSYYSHFHCHSPFKKETTKGNWGAIFKLGFQIAMSDSTFLDFFADYYSQVFHFSGSNHNLFKHDLDCSGFKLGIGFGVYF